MKEDITNFIEFSKYAGERLDLVQAGGGNSSVKLKNGSMLIKASGYSMSEVSHKSGYAIVKTNDVAKILSDKNILKLKQKEKREKMSSMMVNKSTIDKNKPSIETLLHSILLKYTLHTHPIAVNIVLIKPNWKELLKSIFKNTNIICVRYKTPGIDLAIELKNQIEKTNHLPKIIFLQNHGLIISSDKFEEIKQLTEFVISSIEKYLKIDFSIFKTTNDLSEGLKSIGFKNMISYLCSDVYLCKILKKNKDLFFYSPFSPDSHVFCGASAIEINNTSDLDDIIEYRSKYSVLPKIIIFNKNLYIIAKNTKKAREIEDVLKSNLLILEKTDSKINFLPKSELDYLSDWDAEKFRQNI